MSSPTSASRKAGRSSTDQVSEQPQSRQLSEQSTHVGDDNASKEESKVVDRVPTNRSWIEAVRAEVVGWRAWVTGLGSLTLAVLVLNSVLTGLAFHRRHQYPNDRGLATFYVGSCSRTRTINLAIKLGINILASCLLGASNYCMQVLISPLREEVDRAHDRKRWLFIGMPNVKNLFFIHYKRRIVWAFLFLTSVPLHLFWNAAVVHTVASNNYFVAGVSQDFIQRAPAYITPDNTQPWFIGQDQDLYDWLGRARDGDRTSTTILSSEQCLDAYTENFVDEYSNLVMVMDTTNATNSLLFAGTYISEVLSDKGLTDLWPCGLPAPNTRPCGFNRLNRNNATRWTPLTTLAGTAFQNNDTYLVSLSKTPVSYCVADMSNSQCRLSTHPEILVIVLVCNAIKLIGIFVTWFYADMKDDKCITSGELIRSYIRRPDPRFFNRCLAGIDVIRKHPQKFWDATQPWSMTWERQRMRSWHGVPALIWGFYIIPAFCGTVALLGIFLGYDLWRKIYVGFGTPSLDSTLPWRSNILVIQATMVANLPQLIVSYIYVGCNAVLTGIWAQEELMHYSKAVVNTINNRDKTGTSSEKKGKSKRQQRKQAQILESQGPQSLRVTQPRGNQRETYYLTLPWSSSIPLLLSSIALHWFVSESLFLLRVAVINTNGLEDSSNLITTVGYSSGAILAVILTLFVQLLTIMGIGVFKKYDMTMPLVGACSAAIAAISQPAVVDEKDGKNTKFDEDIDLDKLYWGVVGNSKTLLSEKEQMTMKRRKGTQNQSPDGDGGGGCDGDDSNEKRTTTLSGDLGHGDTEERIGFEYYQHATFSAREVEPLVKGKMYA